MADFSDSDPYGSDRYHQRMNEELYHRYGTRMQPSRMSGIWRFLDAATNNTHFALAVTLLVIAAVHYKEPLLRYYNDVAYRLRYMTLSEFIADLWLSVKDHVRALWFWGLEMRRSFGRPLQQTANSGGDIPELVASIPRREVSMEEQDADITTAHETNRVSRATVVPRRRKVRSGVLEPAFQNVDDYPTGWMVYHAILGVVTKEEADEYEKRQNDQRQAALLKVSSSDLSSEETSDSHGSEKENGEINGHQTRSSEEICTERKDGKQNRIQGTQSDNERPKEKIEPEEDPAFPDSPGGTDASSSFATAPSNHLCAAVS